MREEPLSLPRRAGLEVCLAAVLTLTAWWRATDGVSSPGLTSVLFVVAALGVALIVRLSRRRESGGRSEGSADLPAPDRHPRPWRTIPSTQRRRFYVVAGGTVLLAVLLGPILVLSLRRGGTAGEAAPLWIVLALMTLAVVLVWRQLRYPSARTLAFERRPKRPVSHHVLVYLLIAPTYAGSTAAYEALASRPVLAAAAAFGVNLVVAVLVVEVDERLRRKEGRQTREQPPVW